jgi:hypothetical protein
MTVASNELLGDSDRRADDRQGQHTRPVEPLSHSGHP